MIPARNPTPKPESTQTNSTCQTLARQESIAGLLSAIRQLKEPQKRTIELHYLARKTLAETAEEMGVSRTVAARLLANGLKELRPALVDSE